METGIAAQAGTGQVKTIREIGKDLASKKDDGKRKKTFISDGAQEDTIEVWRRDRVKVLVESVNDRSLLGIILRIGPYSIRFRTIAGFDVCMFKTAIISICPNASTLAGDDPVTAG